MIRAACAGLAGGCVLLIGPAQAGVGEWGPSHGPDGGSIGALAIDPQNTQIVYASTGGKVFKTTNGGRSWRPQSSGLSTTNVGPLAIDPRDTQIVYAGARGKVFQDHERR